MIKRFLYYMFLILLNSALLAAPDAFEFSFRIGTVLMIDNSLSMKNSDPEGLRFGAAADLISALPEGSDLSTGLFHGKAALIEDFRTLDDSTKKEMAGSLQNTASKLDYYTNTFEALSIPLEQFRRDSSIYSCRSIVLLSDGHLNIPGDAAVDSAAIEKIYSDLLPDCRSRNIHIYSIALTSNTDRELLNAMADSCGGGYYYAASADSLLTVFRSVGRDINDMMAGEHAEAVGQHAELISKTEGRKKSKEFIESQIKTVDNKIIPQKYQHYISGVRMGFQFYLIVFTAPLITLLFVIILSRKNHKDILILQKQISELAMNLAEHSSTSRVSFVVGDKIINGHTAKAPGGLTSAGTVQNSAKNIPGLMTQDSPNIEEQVPSASSQNDEPDTIPESDGSSAPETEEYLRSEDVPEEEQVSSSSSSEGSRCVIHSDRESTCWCSKCGRTFCEICNPDNTDPYICDDCNDAEDTKRILGLM